MMNWDNLNLQALMRARSPVQNLLMEMARVGSSIVLNWGEDNNIWECSWIVGGVRYSAFKADFESGVRQCVQKAIEATGE